MINRYDREKEILVELLDTADSDYNFKLRIARLITDLEIGHQYLETKIENLKLSVTSSRMIR